MFNGLCESMICEICESSASGDIQYLICQVNSKNHLIEGSYNFKNGPFYGRSPPYITCLKAYMNL